MPLGFLSLLYLYTNYGYLKMIKMLVLFCNNPLSFAPACGKVWGCHGNLGLLYASLPCIYTGRDLRTSF
ncbi:hypothetical protein QVD17_39083 [Tagetes erecta]|uniref:Uncharacterized protein n=1 Tax=Tagetes erecta TaxID=13708 RepID=A0AAD8JMY4_TARER|nr:hypothetical protein QVD17_39083 [Tagetes erecta]